MSVIPGTHFDLTHLNKATADVKKKDTYFSQAFETQSNTEVEVGTSFSFSTGKAARRIQVVFA